MGLSFCDIGLRYEYMKECGVLGVIKCLRCLLKGLECLARTHEKECCDSHRWAYFIIFKGLSLCVIDAGLVFM